jgi:hypothetical protein
MRAALLVCLMFAVVFSACGKKTFPEFYKLEAQQSALISRDGEDAYVSPEMDAVIAGLLAVPENAREHDRAAELVGTLQREQQRIKAERQAAVGVTAPVEAAMPPPVLPRVVEEAPTTDTPVTPPAPSEPVGGMEEKAFVAAFGKCFSSGSPQPGADGGPANTQVLRDSPECLKRFGQAGAKTTYIFGSADGLQRKRTEILTETRTEKTVTTETKPSPPAPEGAETIFRVTGAPVPAGYQLPDAG